MNSSGKFAPADLRLSGNTRQNAEGSSHRDGFHSSNTMNGWRPNYCPRHLHNYSAFSPAKHSIEIVNCSGRGRSQRKSHLMTNASPSSSWHTSWSFKRIAGANSMRKMRVLPPNHMELQWRVHTLHLHTKSPEEAAISVGFIKPTKQFKSFVQKSSTSLINKSWDIIFSPAFFKSLKCQAF